MQGYTLLAILLLVSYASAAGPKFAPYFDVFLPGRSDLRDIVAKTGQKDYHLAFALGGHLGCVPMWGGQYSIDDPEILEPIKAVQAQGGQLIIAFGGALGPYLEHLCTTSDELATAYKIVLDVVGTNHIDVDIEAPVNFEIMNQALAQVQRERPDVTVTFTLMVQGEDYGLTPALGVDLLVNAKKNGVRVDIVNAMAMEFGTISPDYGDAVINVGVSVLRQMAEIWPEKSSEELRKMLGITPMIGRNFSGKKFEIAHGRKLVEWANLFKIGLLAFWSAERDNGGCNDIVSPTCSGVPQEEFEFTQIFQGFRK